MNNRLKHKIYFDPDAFEEDLSDATTSQWTLPSEELQKQIIWATEIMDRLAKRAEAAVDHGKGQASVIDIVEAESRP